MRVWKIRVTTHHSPVGEPYYDNYIYIDKTGKENKNRIRLNFYHHYYNDLFERPETTIEYMRQDDSISLSAKQIAELFIGKTAFMKLGW